MSLSFHLFMFSISCFKIIVSYVYCFFIYYCGTNCCFGDCGTNNYFADHDLEKEVGFVGCNELGCLGFYLLGVFCHGIAKGGDC